MPGRKTNPMDLEPRFQWPLHRYRVGQTMYCKSVGRPKILADFLHILLQFAGLTLESTLKQATTAFPYLLWAGRYGDRIPVRKRFSSAVQTWLWFHQLRAGRYGDRIPVGKRFSSPVQTWLWVHQPPSQCVLGKAAGAWRWTPTHTLRWGERNNMAIPLLPLWAFVEYSRVKFTLTFATLLSYASVSVVHSQSPVCHFTLMQFTHHHH
jgi:hypothetical protein